MAGALLAAEPVAEIKSFDDFRRLAEKVRAEQKPRLVSIAGGGEITLAPVKRSKKKRGEMTPEEKAKADDEAFLATAGALEDLLDAEEFKRQYKAARGQKREPLVIDWPTE